ncbi:MAG TPA: hypothetical protein VG248_14660 [Caulobacteraceae bacterium]|nr:hypothetical protein [Caulobacteraceae bacterium]
MNKKSIFAAAGLIAAVSLSACDKAATVDKAQVAQDIKANWTKISRDFNEGDASGATASDAPDVVNMFHGQPNAVGPEADLATTKQFIASGPLKESFADETVDVAQAGDMAVYRAVYRATYTDARTHKAVNETGNVVTGYKKQSDGSWKIAWTISADMPAATQVASKN